VKIGIRNYLQGAGRWPAIAGILLVVALLAAPVQAPEPGSDHPNDMNCGNIFWLTPPTPDPADPDYEFYREKMDRGCRKARVTRGATTVMVSMITIFGVALLARRHEKSLPDRKSSSVGP
jgi:hypothetical protein